MPRLSEEKYKDTFGTGMKDITGISIPGGAVDIWPYVRLIQKADWEGHAVIEDKVEKVTENERYHHVLVMTRTKNVYMVVVVRRDSPLIAGHHLLDLNRLYGNISPKDAISED